MTLDPHAAAVADAFLDEQAERRDHLVVALSGAHAYGFPSPDSDLDLKAVHVAPTRTLLGLGTPEQVADRLEVIEGVEVDYTSNEIGGVISGVLAGNGNYLERICGAFLLRRDPDLDELQVLTRAALSRRFHHHYRGFAKAQRKALDRTQAASTKKALYVLRTTLTGRHLLETGELVVDVRELHDRSASPTRPSSSPVRRRGRRSRSPRPTSSAGAPASTRPSPPSTTPASAPPSPTKLPTNPPSTTGWSPCAAAATAEPSTRAPRPSTDRVIG
ncbi:MAG: nucleotidyltransferase domain-containing protein [Polyangiaceae bacterium]